MTSPVRIAGTIGFMVLLSLSINPVRADPGQVFYLHKWTFENSFEYLLDENQPTQYSTPVDLDYIPYYWRTSYVSSNISVEASTWTVSLWLGYTVQSTSLHIAVGYLFEGVYHVVAQGNITGILQFPKKYVLGLATNAFQIPAGGALALELTPVRDTLNPTPNVVLYMDSATTPSQVSVDPATPIPEFWIGAPTLGGALLLIILIFKVCSPRKKQLPILTF
jgi:hypothetical protein